MSKIDFYEDTMKDASRKDALQKKINTVLNKIHETDTDINWYIFDEYNKPNISLIEECIKKHYRPFLKENTLATFLLKKDICPGLASPKTNTIWIYKNAITPTPIMPSFLQEIYEQTYASVYGKPKNDTLANILMDELAHIKTGKNHGNDIYDSTLQKYINKFYNIPSLHSTNNSAHGLGML